MGSPVPQEVSDELKRVVERWQQLPLDHALSRMPLAREVVQALADRVSGSRGRSHTEVPDLGPAVVMDQLTVMVHDVFVTEPDADPTDVVTALSGIRKGL
ncbi:hypothetical protein N865_21035 [Intrasporangium oryzae NRRL B-24470]|uniref:Uncharacterized protein n=1 Tax=Intrasporangium oryzae NRRL B-24470 TaxID=1386089 RepID=W9G776_9MICO|nr:hypothetical protein [Intrasporangium oryzae]EWS99733.1 hypothetical protein N865_21035 [Intrasporangium oryzae NRRL B-24470]